ncbi:hypothetical protein [Vibrio quintilis]|nr:hypothetical protein [Vibrio quintilis]
MWVNIFFAHSFGKCVLSRHMKEVHRLTREIGGQGIELYTTVERLASFLVRQGFTNDSDSRVQHWIKEIK